MNTKTLMAYGIVTLLVGCAGEDAMRKTAATSASMVNDYRKGLENYFHAENQTLGATEARVNDLMKDQQLIAGSVDTRMTAWKAIKNDAAINLYSALTTVSGETILATSPELRTLQPVAASPVVQVDTKQFDAVVKSLSTLSKDPSFTDRVKFLSKYGSAVSTAYKASLDKAAAKATEDTSTTKAINPNK